MVFGAILAGGMGNRMGSDIPKQFLELGGKPVIIYSIEAFLSNNKIDKVLVLCPNAWINHLRALLDSYLPVSISGQVHVLEGGITRNDTIMNAITYIQSLGEYDDDTIIVTHDAARPFVTDRIISDGVDGALEYGASSTYIGATDTIAASSDGETIERVYDRSVLYQAQTPQTFKAKRLKELYESLSEDEKDKLTDGVGIYIARGESVHLIKGEPYNIKITYPYDIKLAEAILNTIENE